MARILLIDDDPAGVDPRRMILERLGHAVAVAHNPAAARASFSQARPDIVVMDLRLPEAEDGLALIRDFRASSGELRIVVLAGWPGDLDGRPEALLVDEVLKKPVRSERLLHAIGR